MSQLDSLVKFIKDNVPERAMIEFDSYMDNPKLQRSNKNLGLDQRRLGVLIYDGVLSWDRFPYTEFDPQILFALVLIWLTDNSLDDNFQLEEPTVDLELIDTKTAILSITVGMVDEIRVKSDENGAIPMKGKKWAICSPEIWTAEDGTLFTADGVGAPIIELELQ